MTLRTYHARPNNMACHDLCTTKKPPPGVKRLLGLNLSFCIQSKTPNPENIEKTVNRLFRDIRIKDFVKNLKTDNDREHIPRLYIKNMDFDPPKANDKIEKSLTAFAEGLRKEANSKKQRPAYNLTKQQQNLMKTLQKNDEFIITPADKNLGPCILEREIYVKKALDEHLLDKKTYRKLTQEEANHFISSASNRIKIITNRSTKMRPAEKKYIFRSIALATRFAQFYLTIKVHKDPVKTRPVVSTCGSQLAGASIWVNYHLHAAVKFIKTYLSDSINLLKMLPKSPIPIGTKLFTTDAVSMYTNLDTDHAMIVIRRFLLRHMDKLPPNFPINELMDILEIIMRHNIFMFGDTYWQQLIGSAMGTPCACDYSELYYGEHENTVLLPKYAEGPNPNLKFAKRLIDDLFGIYGIPPEIIHSKNLRMTYHSVALGGKRASSQKQYTFSM